MRPVSELNADAVGESGRYHHGDLRTALLEATGATLCERGIEGVTLREVARRAGVSHAAPAHHFPSKAHLLTAFAARGFAQLGASIAAALQRVPPSDPRRRLQAVGEGYVRFAVANPEPFGLMFRMDALIEDDPGLRAASDTAYGMLRAVVAECVTAGFARRSEAELIAVSAWSIVHGLSVLWIGGRLPHRITERDHRRLARTVSAFFVDRVLPEPPATERFARKYTGG